MQTKNLTLPLLFRRKLLVWRELTCLIVDVRLVQPNPAAASDAFKDCQKSAFHKIGLGLHFTSIISYKNVSLLVYDKRLFLNVYFADWESFVFCDHRITIGRFFPTSHAR